jgi:endonuclease/exonuclease/phosphatase family metal-dependent hydrolase
MLVARLETGDGPEPVVVVAHPVPAAFDWDPDGPRLAGYDPSHRDRQLAAIRDAIEPWVQDGDPIILLGDFNVVDRELGYADLASGLVDAQRAVGLGTGLTWRPPELEWLPFGLLRIDMVFSANGVRPLRIDVDCTPRGSDHCIVRATLELP